MASCTYSRQMNLGLYLECVHEASLCAHYFSRHLVAEDCWASGKTSWRCNPGRDMLSVRICNVDFGHIFHKMPHVMHDKWWLWGHKILVQKHNSHPGLWPKRENISYIITISYNTLQPGILLDRNQLPCGLQKYLRPVVSLLAKIGTSMSSTEILLSAMKTRTGSL